MSYTSGSGRIEFKMTLEQAESVSHSGQCNLDVRALSQVPAIRRQLGKIDAATLAGELKEYGAWDASELADHEQNLQRILWLAGCDISENRRESCNNPQDLQSGKTFIILNKKRRYFYGIQLHSRRKQHSRRYRPHDLFYLGCFTTIRLGTNFSAPSKRAACWSSVIWK